MLPTCAGRGDPGIAVNATLSAPDAALVTFARVLHQALGCSWVAVAPIQSGAHAIQRHVVDLATTPEHVRADPAYAITADGIRVLQLPEDRLRLQGNQPPASSKTYRTIPLHIGTVMVGRLELAWSERQDDPDLRRLGALLPLAALLADDRLMRRRLEDLERERPYLRGELRAGGDLRSLTGDGPAMRAVRLAI
jgi:hypothetical protein